MTEFVTLRFKTALQKRLSEVKEAVTSIFIFTLCAWAVHVPQILRQSTYPKTRVTV